MQLDIETLRWILSGIFYLWSPYDLGLNRTVKVADEKIADHEVRIKETATSMKRNSTSPRISLAKSTLKSNSKHISRQSAMT